MREAPRKTSVTAPQEAPKAGSFWKGPSDVFPGEMFKTWSLLPEFLSHHTQGHFNENSTVWAKRIELLLILQQGVIWSPDPAGVISVCPPSEQRSRQEGEVASAGGRAPSPSACVGELLLPQTQGPGPPHTPSLPLRPRDGADGQGSPSAREAFRTPLLFGYDHPFAEKAEWDWNVPPVLRAQSLLSRAGMQWAGDTPPSSPEHCPSSQNSVLSKEMGNQRKDLGAFLFSFSLVCFHFLTSWVIEK